MNTARKLRIVAHIGARIIGGAELSMLRRLQGLQRRGHHVVLCCNHDVIMAEAARWQVEAVRMPLRGDLVLGDAVRFARFLRRERADVLVICTFKKIWLAGMAAALAGVHGTVASVGLASDTPRRLKYRIALRRWIDTVVLNAATLRRPFIAGLGAPADVRVLVVHDGVDPSPVLQSPADFRASLGIPRGAVVIGTVARLARQKRLERLIDALALLPNHVHAVITGEGGERALIEEAIAHHGLQKRVHLLGHRNDVGTCLAALDVYVVTSDQEGMSGAMLEALAAGLPVVSTPVSGAAEALEPLPNGARPGVITDGFTAEAVAAELKPLIADTQMCAAMGAAAATASERFTLQSMVDSWETVLLEVANRVSRPRGSARG